MLNKVLYGKVKQVFGDVEVLDENQTPKLKRKFDKWYFDKSQEGTYGETYRVNCPICGDRKGHCFISALSFTSPVVAGTVMPPAPLIIHCFRRDCFKDPLAVSEVARRLKTGEPLQLACEEVEESLFGESQHEDLRSTDMGTILKWQPDYHPLEKDAPAEVLDYVAQRGIRECDIKELQIGWGRCWNFKKGSFIGADNWLMFPIIDQAGLRGFQSRQLKDTSNMKYFFDARTPKKMCLYNRQRAAKFPIVAIAEGIFDALHIGRCGMAFFGFEPSKQQEKLLMQDGAKMVLYIPDQKKHYTASGKCDLDPPAIADVWIQKWNSNKAFEWGAYRIDVPKGDAGECTMEEVWTAILEQMAANERVPEVALENLIKMTNEV